MTTTRTCILALALLALPGTALGGAVLIDGLGGPENFGELAMSPNDDESSNALALPGGFDPDGVDVGPLPASLNFFGQTWDSFFINNNGNITFDGPRFNYTPTPFPVPGNQPMIAPYWGDVDTRATNGGNVYVASPNADNVIVTWKDVGYYNRHADLTNSFQLILTQRNDVGVGDFDIEFRYDTLEWTTGDASGGSGGFGGTPAQAGFDSGNGVDFLTLPGSRTPTVVDLQDTTNVPAPGDEPGVWRFEIRNGSAPGSSPDNPLLPIVIDGGYNFDFGVILGQQVWIDPIVAIGYDYILNSGPLYDSVTLPTGIGDDLYDLYLWDATGMSWTFNTGLAGGSQHFFGGSGVDRFRVLGIETTANLDPLDPLAFVTGLTFAGAGTVNMDMLPITFNTGPIPEPGSAWLMAVGMTGLLVRRRRRR